MSANHTPMCIWNDCGSDAIYCEGHAREYMAPDIDALKARERELVEALRLLLPFANAEQTGTVEEVQAAQDNARAVLTKARP